MISVGRIFILSMINFETHKFGSHLSFCLLSLYKEQKIDGTNSGVKWSCPNIHDLMTILDKIKVDCILDSIFDKRLTKVEQLPIAQLREECQCLNLDKNGNKVFMYKS